MTIARNQKTIHVELAPWVLQIVCDPLSKSRLEIGQNECVSDYGRTYPIKNGVPDLRLLTAHVGLIGQAWKEGQDAYESWRAKAATTTLEEQYVAQRNCVADVYEAIPIIGRCLDVGGNDGRLRAFLSDGQEYISVDPYIGVVSEPRSEAWARAYPYLDKPLNFIAALAENLPFATASFDVIHMRSVIDHFLNPEQAMREAFRILRPGGYAVIGLYVKGGRYGRDLKVTMKEIVRSVLVGIGMKQFRDHHIWHPTYGELCQMLKEVGFSIEKTYWQKSENNRVCYIKAVRS
jgi:SAM-dependent methyltransferase